jgi:hypothetical protein
MKNMGIVGVFAADLHFRKGKLAFFPDLIQPKK